MATPEATATAARSSEAEARAAESMPESRAERPMVSEEQAALSETSEGMVGCVVWPLSPQVVPPAVEEDEVEEIEREES